MNAQTHKNNANSRSLIFSPIFLNRVVLPVVALLIAWLWLQEVPTPISLLGGTIVFCGVMLVNRRT
ncbi:EamA family transporter [Scytonema sp. UIC 10036]|nr:EamA family transporter [Scytonema sp. UIC 10036]